MLATSPTSLTTLNVTTPKAKPDSPSSLWKTLLLEASSVNGPLGTDSVNQGSKTIILLGTRFHPKYRPQNQVFLSNNSKKKGDSKSGKSSLKKTLLEQWGHTPSKDTLGTSTGPLSYSFVECKPPLDSDLNG
jgi:hypothetical protein